MIETRRGLLKRAGTGFATALPGLTGCLAASRSGRRPGRIAHASWLYGPEAVDSSPHNSFFALNLATIRSRRGGFRRPTYSKYTNYVDYLDLDVLDATSTEVDSLLEVFPLTSTPVQSAVLSVTDDRGELRAELHRRFDLRTTYRGFDLYRPADDREVAIGVADRYVLIGYPTETHAPGGVVRALIDAKAGAIDRYVGANPDFDRLLGRLGPGDDVSGFTHPPPSETAAARGVFRNAVAKGHRYVFGHHTTLSRYVFVFASEDDVDPAAVSAWIDANDDPGDRLFGGYEDVTVSRTDRSVIVDGALRTETI